MVVHFRKRFSDEDLMRINEVVVQRDKEMVIESVIDDSGVLDLGCAGQDAVTVAPENLAKELQATLKYYVKTPRFHC